MLTGAPAQILLALLLVALSLTAGPVAYSYWTGSGGGAGSGKTATTVGLTLSKGTVSTALYPGGSASVGLTVSNPNLSPVRIGTFVLDTSTVPSGFAFDSSHSGCSLASLTFTPPTNGWTVPAKSGGANGALSVSLSTAVRMAADAASACQGATITVFLAADYVAAI